MGRALCPHGVMLVVPDYRNFPQVPIQPHAGRMPALCRLYLGIADGKPVVRVWALNMTAVPR